MVVAAAALCMSLPAAAEPPPIDAQEAYVRAGKARTAGDHRTALKWLRVAHRTSPQPTYLYNIGRTLEALDRLGEAYQTYLTVVAYEGVPDELKALAQARGTALKSVAERCVLRFDVAAGSLVQVDDGLVSQRRADYAVARGKHLICVFAKASSSARCWQRELEVGRRTPWPPAQMDGARGTIRLPAALGLTGIQLNKRDLIVDAGAVRELELDAGRHHLVLTRASGSPVETEVRVLPKRSTTINADAAAHDSSLRTWAWVTAGVALAAGGAAAGMYGWSESLAADSETLNHEATELSAYNAARADIESNFETARAAGMALSIAGGVLAATSVVLFAMDATSPPSATIVPMATRAGGGLSAVIGF